MEKAEDYQNRNNGKMNKVLLPQNSKERQKYLYYFLQINQTIEEFSEVIVIKCL